MARIDNEGKVVDDGCFKDLIKDYDDYKYPQNIPHVCPNCGYCPTCGRRTWPQGYPWYEVWC